MFSENFLKNLLATPLASNDPPLNMLNTIRGYWTSVSLDVHRLMDRDTFNYFSRGFITLSCGELLEMVQFTLWIFICTQHLPISKKWIFRPSPFLNFNIVPADEKKIKKAQNFSSTSFCSNRLIFKGDRSQLRKFCYVGIGSECITLKLFFKGRSSGFGNRETGTLYCVLRQRAHGRNLIQDTLDWGAEPIHVGQKLFQGLFKAKSFFWGK